MRLSLPLVIAILAAGCWPPLPSKSQPASPSPVTEPMPAAVPSLPTLPEITAAKPDTGLRIPEGLDEASRLLLERNWARAIKPRDNQEYASAIGYLSSPRGYKSGGREALLELVASASVSLAAAGLSEKDYLERRDRFFALLDSIEFTDRDSRAVPGLVRVLQDKDADHRRRAAIYLSTLKAKAKDAIPALEKLKDDPNDDVATEAIGAIRVIRGEKK